MAGASLNGPVSLVEAGPFCCPSFDSQPNRKRGIDSPLLFPNTPWQGLKPATRSKRPTRTDSESTLKLPAFRQPQKAQLRRELPAGDDWLFKVKYDGYRAQAAIGGDKVRIYSSSGIDWTGKQFAWLVPAFRDLRPGPPDRQRGLRAR